MNRSKFLLFFSEVVKQKRKQIGLTQQELADSVGLSRVQIVNIEKGKNGTTNEGAYNLCCAFACDPSELFPPIKPTSRKTVVVEKTVLVPTIRKTEKIKLGKVK